MIKDSVLEKQNEIEQKLKDFENKEREKLDLLPNYSNHWTRPKENNFLKKERGFTTILIGGLTLAHDHIVCGALEGLGYKVQNLDNPDNDALRFGKEYGNRGQCNPTYYTVGNLVKYLIHLRDVEGMKTEDIIKNHVFLTASSCGPCRFGMYEAEYRKALWDSGFEGFRVLTFEQKFDAQEAEEMGLEVNMKFIMALIKSFIAADIVNALGYRIRPYEINEGDTDKAIEESKQLLYNCFKEKKSLIKALWQVRKKFSKIKVNFLEPKPVVDIIGEFWAMTTEGDGNYNMQRWLEKEGAEVNIQQVTFWLQYILWELEKFYLDRINLKKHDNNGLADTKNPKKVLRWISIGKLLLKGHYYVYTRVAGLKNQKLNDMDEIADLAHQYYNTSLSGGEGHMEVGKLISAAKHKKSHMVLSIKPFGCMPSSAVSDGIQSKVQELYPEILFYPIETSGDGAVNIYSRVQMVLHKAKKRAKEEFDQILNDFDTTEEELQKQYQNKASYQKGTHRSKHREISTASNVALDIL